MLFFGITRAYQGTALEGGAKVAETLYATAESRAIESLSPSDEAFAELFCDYRNARGLAFWRQLGFRDIGPAYGKEELRRHLRYLR